MRYKKYPFHAYLYIYTIVHFFPPFLGRWFIFHSRAQHNYEIKKIERLTQTDEKNRNNLTLAFHLEYKKNNNVLRAIAWFYDLTKKISSIPLYADIIFFNIFFFFTFYWELPWRMLSRTWFMTRTYFISLVTIFLYPSAPLPLPPTPITCYPFSRVLDGIINRLNYFSLD